MYLVVDEATKLAAAVDPVDPARMIAAASRLCGRFPTPLFLAPRARRSCAF
jgi:hypothetical protein